MAQTATPGSAPKRHRLGTVLLIVLVLWGVFVAWSLIEPRFLRVSETTVTSPDIPAEFSGTRVVYLADVHAGPYYSRRRVAKLIDRVISLHPDLILVGGDNVGGRHGGAAKFYPEARRLAAPLGVYGVLGNHDYWEGEAESKRLCAEAGIQLIDNTNIPIYKGGVSIRLGGVEDLWQGKPDFVKAAAGVSPQEFGLLLSHNPDALHDGLPKTPNTWDLSLTGHMHAGQITFFGLWAPIVPSSYGQHYRNGWLAENACLILITNGVGEVTVPMRFFAPPEINVITLEKGPALGVEGARVKH